VKREISPIKKVDDLAFDFSSDDMQCLRIEHMKYVSFLKHQYDQSLKEQKESLIYEFDKKMVFKII